MNALELADELKWLYENLEVHTSMLEAATMLRQLQAEIEALKAKTSTDAQIRKLYLYAFTDGELKYKRPNDAAFRRWAKEKMTEEL